MVVFTEDGKFSDTVKTTKVFRCPGSRDDIGEIGGIGGIGEDRIIFVDFGFGSSSMSVSRFLEPLCRHLHRGDSVTPFSVLVSTLYRLKSN